MLANNKKAFFFFHVPHRFHNFVNDLKALEAFLLITEISFAQASKDHWDLLLVIVHFSSCLSRSRIGEGFREHSGGILHRFSDRGYKQKCETKENSEDN